MRHLGWVWFHLASVETNFGEMWIRDANAVDPNSYGTFGGIAANATGDFEILLPKSTSRRRLTLMATENPAVSILFAIPKLLLGKETGFEVWMAMHNLLYPPKKLVVETGSSSKGP